MEKKFSSLKNFESLKIQNTIQLKGGSGTSSTEYRVSGGVKDGPATGDWYPDC